MILPKGTEILNLGNGVSAVLANDAEIEFNREIESDELASIFVCADRKDLLKLLNNDEVKYTRQGEPIRVVVEETEPIRGFEYVLESGGAWTGNIRYDKEDEVPTTEAQTVPIKEVVEVTEDFVEEVAKPPKKKGK
jgi:hypothetical protein